MRCFFVLFWPAGLGRPAGRKARSPLRGAKRTAIRAIQRQQHPWGAGELHHRRHTGANARVIEPDHCETGRFGGCVARNFLSRALLTQPGGAVFRARNRIASPGNHFTSPGKDPKCPGNDSKSPGDDSKSPGKDPKCHNNDPKCLGKDSKSPGDHSKCPGDHSRSPRNDSQSPFNHSASPRDRSTNPVDHFPSLTDNFSDAQNRFCRTLRFPRTISGAIVHRKADAAFRLYFRQ